MNFTSQKPLNLPNYLFKSLVKMTEKVQTKGRDHQKSLFHHALIKVIILHQLAQVSMSWEAFLKATSLLSVSHQSKSLNTPTSSMPHRHEPSRIPSVIRTQPREEISKKYNICKRLVFTPEIEREMPSPKPRTRSQAKRLPKEVVSEK